MASLVLSSYNDECRNRDYRPNKADTFNPASDGERTTARNHITCEHLLLDSTLALVANDGNEDDEEFVSDDELIALLSSGRAERDHSSSCSAHPHREPIIIPASEKTSSRACGGGILNSAASKTVTTSSPMAASVRGNYERVYSVVAPVLYSNTTTSCNNSHSQPQSHHDRVRSIMQARTHNYHHQYYHNNVYYSEVDSVCAHPWSASLQRKVYSEKATPAYASAESQIQEAYAYVPTYEMRKSREKRPSVIEFETWAAQTSTRLAHLFEQTQPNQVATNPGSAEHHEMKCKPCIFKSKPRGCLDWNNCSFCHLCDGEIFRCKENIKTKVAKRIKRLADRRRPKCELDAVREMVAHFRLM